MQLVASKKVMVLKFCLRLNLTDVKLSHKFNNLNKKYFKYAN